MNEMMMIPRQDYDRRWAVAENLADLQAYDRAATGLKSGDRELMPTDYVDGLLNEKSALRDCRGLRGLTQAALAKIR